MDTENLLQVRACRGLQGECPSSLWNDPSVVQGVQEVFRDCPWLPAAAQHQGGGPIRHHMQFKVALAACPNACTLPQVQDIGVIATLTPRGVRPKCTGCGECVRTCREGAVAIPTDRAELRVDRCVGCGACIRTCQYHAFEPSPVQLRVLVGGRIGRHPRWAESLCVVDPSALTRVLGAFLEIAAREAPAERRAAPVVEKIGIERLRQNVCPAACAATSERSI